MPTLESLKRRIKSGEDLESVVHTMKTLAAVNIRQYEKAVEALAEYNRTIEMGLYAVLRGASTDVTARPSVRYGGLGIVVFGSDQGLCGRFNDIIASHALEEMTALEPDADHRSILCVGGRVQAHLEEAHQPIEGIFNVPGSLTAISLMIQDLLFHMDKLQSTGSIDRIVLFYNKIHSGFSYLPQTVHLLPLDQTWLQQMGRRDWPTNTLPAFTMNRSRLFSALIHQYLFVSLYRAFAESMASENASRLTSMQAAERNIGETLEAFNKSLNHQRQSGITDELLDIVSGFEALTRQAPNEAHGGGSNESE